MKCIYKILNKNSSKFYIGRTTNFKRRVYAHKHRMKKGTHGNQALNRACAKHGVDAFEYIILEECTSENIIEREQWYIDNTCIPNWDMCYNMSKNSKDGGNLCSPEQRKAQSIRQTGKFIGADNPNWKGGKSKTECKSCNKIIKQHDNSRTKLCRKCYFKQRDISGENNPFYGKTHSKEFCENMSKTRKGKYFGPQEKPVIIGDIEYKSISEAGRQLKVDPGTIIHRIKSKNPKFKNYFYK